MRISTKKLEARTFSGILRYVWFQDLASGRAPRVYTVLALSEKDPVVIGRELDEKYIRDLVRDYEAAALKLQNKGEWYYGQRNFALTLRNTVSELRRKRKLRT